MAKQLNKASKNILISVGVLFLVTMLAFLLLLMNDKLTGSMFWVMFYVYGAIYALMFYVSVWVAHRIKNIYVGGVMFVALLGVFWAMLILSIK